VGISRVIVENDTSAFRRRKWRSLNVLQGYVRDGRSLDDGNPLRATGL
jgi:hypothetical protein